MKKLISLLLISALLLCGLCGCGDTKKTGEIKVTDQLGSEVIIEKIPERIVSGYYISSSALIALGLKNKIVGVESGSDKRPVYSKAAKELITNAADVGTAKNFDVEACLAANPDLVVLPKKAKDNVATLEAFGIPVIVVDPETNVSLLQMITILGKATGTEERAEKLVSFITEKTEEIKSLLKDAPKEKVCICNPGSYLKVAPSGMYQSDIIDIAGGKNAFDGIEDNIWATISYEEMLAADPDIIIIPTNSNANGDPEYVNELLSDKALSELSAIKNGRVYIMPSGFESWDSPVPSGVLGILWLAKTLHPDIYSEEEFAKEVNEFYKDFYGFDAAYNK